MSMPATLEANLEQQVMSAQGSAAHHSAVLVNGTTGTNGYGATNSSPIPPPPRDDEQQVEASGSGRASGQGLSASAGEVDAGWDAAASPEVEAAGGQTGPMNRPVDHDVAYTEAAVFQGAEYFTPRSRTSMAPWGPFPQMETLPSGWSWISRVGARIMGAIGSNELVPSPLASPPRQVGGSSTLTPQGPRPRGQNLTPPSSSGLSVEAVQAEVQRQLGPLLDRLEMAEQRNSLLEGQLKQQMTAGMATTKTLRSPTEQPATTASSSWSAALGLPRHEVPLPPSLPRKEPLGWTGMHGGPLADEHGFPEPRRHSHQEPTQDGGVRQSLASVAEDSAGNVGPLCKDRDASETGRGNMASGGEGSSAHRGRSREGLGSFEGVYGNAGAEPTGSQGILGSLFSRNKGRSPSPPPDQGGLTSAPMIEAIARGVRQLQELQERNLQGARGGDSPGGTETVKPGLQALLTLTVPGTKDAPLVFQDWIEVISTGMKDLSENSGAWWEAVLRTVEGSYSKWLGATQLERLTIQPEDADYAVKGRWTRVNARACQLLLNAVPEVVRSDLIARRATQDVTQLVFRLFVLYQPGGSSERGHTLAQLQSPPHGTNVAETLEILRGWPRHLRRCQQLGMSAPDPTVLAKGLDMATAKVITGNPDAHFRTQLLRTSLRLDAKPTLRQVEDYQRHLQAEVEQMAAAGGMDTNPKIRATSTSSMPHPGTTMTSSPPTSPTGKDTNEALCRYFSKPSGCRRGEKCPYKHDMASFPKDQRMKKCLACGAEGHRARECPTKGGGKRSHAKREEGAERMQIPPTTPKVAEIQATSAEAIPSSSSSTIMSSSGSSIPPSAATIGSAEGVATTPGEPVWTLDNLMQAAQQVVMAKSAGEKGDIKLKAAKVMELDAINERSDRAPMALADTGATHSLRHPHSQEEWDQSMWVNVVLAGGEQVQMKMNNAGTLLFGADGTARETTTNAIVPVGELVKTLGYRFEWGPASCHLVGPDGTIVRLSTKEGCPHISEARALELISKIEKKKLDQFTENVKGTEARVQAMARTLDKSWFDYLGEACYGHSGQEDKAVAAAPFLKDVPAEALYGLATKWTMRVDGRS